MTWEIAFLLVVLASMVYLFLTEKLPVDLTAFGGLAILIIAGYVEPGEAFTGFASAAVITMLAIFFVSGGLQNTGVADSMGNRIHALVGNREVPLIVVIMLVAGVLSAFMNNVAATAVLMPAVVSLARQAKTPPSRLLMPLAFGAILGGTTTLVGTPPNILAAQMLHERDLVPFRLFDFTPFGLVLLAAGILFMATVGRRLLPARSSAMAAGSGIDPAGVYKLEEHLFSLRIPAGSPLEGKSLEAARLGTTLGVQVVAIIRDGREQLAPRAEEVIRGGDLLVVGGNFTNLQESLQVQGIELEESSAVRLAEASGAVTGLVVSLAPGSPLRGMTLKELRFRDRYGVVVAGIWRSGELLRDQLALQSLRQEDEILVLGEPREIERFARQPDVEVVARGAEALARIDESLFLVRISHRSHLDGKTVAESRMGELVGMTVVGILRHGQTLLNVGPFDVLHAGDELLVTGEPTRLMSLLELGEVEVAREVPESRFESSDVGVVEAIVAPRSTVAGKTLRELAFRSRYGLQALAFWHGGQAVGASLAQLPLRIGDGLLLQGPREKIRLLAADPDFVVLGADQQEPRRTSRAPFALGALGLMILIVVTGWLPIQAAAFIAAVVTVASGALTMEEAYRAVEWRAIFLVAAILPAGIAIERTGAAQLLADNLASVAGGMGPYAVLAALMVLSSMLSQGLDGAPTVVLLAPVVIFTAEQLSLNPYPLMMGVGLAASAAFMTPFSHKANLLVMGAGGYRSMDYVRVGTPLTIIVLAVMVVLIPWVIPF